MPEPIEFAKLSGSGNDFICIDNREGRFDSMLSDLKAAGHFARSLCRRGLGLGGDGVIFARQKFCEPHAFDYVTLKRALDDANVPHLGVELEQTPHVGQMRTRVEAFLEMVGHR